MDILKEIEKIYEEYVCSALDKTHKNYLELIELEQDEVIMIDENKFKELFEINEKEFKSLAFASPYGSSDL